MQEALRKVSPTEFDDLVALVALYRPGAMDQIPDVRARQAQPGVGRLPRRAPAPDHGVHEGRDPLPGAVDADRQVAGGLLAAPRRTTCARRSARRTATRWRSSSPSSSRAAAPPAPRRQVIEHALGRRTRRPLTTPSTSAPSARHPGDPPGRDAHAPVRGVPAAAAPRSCRCGPTARSARTRSQRIVKTGRKPVVPRSLRERPPDQGDAGSPAPDDRGLPRDPRPGGRRPS